MATRPKGEGGKFVKRDAEPAVEPEPEPAASGEGGDGASVAVAAPAPEPSNDRCPELNAAGDQCLWIIHDPIYPHMFDITALPQVAEPDPRAETVMYPVRKANDNSWWCGRCDNAQLRTDAKVCRKCGAVPTFV